MDKSKILENIKDNIAIDNFREINQKHEKVKRMLQSSLMVTVCCLSLTGMVFAKDISTRIYNKFYTGTGVENAINEGHIEKIEMEDQGSITTIENEKTEKIIKDKETKIKVADLVMDNYSLSMTFEVTLSDDVKDIITASEVKDMNFSDIVLYDENKLALYALDDNAIDKCCDKNNIVIEKALGSGVNNFVSEYEGNTVKVVYNFFGGGNIVFPNCKEINIDINEIRVSKDPECATGDEEIKITGDWNFKVDVPAIMYNRDEIQYVQKSTTNQDFNVASAVLYNTGMELKIKLKTEGYKSSQEIGSAVSEELAFYYSLDKNDKLKTLDMLNYLERKAMEKPEYQELQSNAMEVWRFEKYLTNSNGEKFEFTVGPKANGEASIADGIMTSTCMFDLTQHDATDEITLHLEYQGKKAKIVLEKLDKE